MDMQVKCDSLWLVLGSGCKPCDLPTSVFSSIEKASAASFYRELLGIKSPFFDKMKKKRAFLASLAFMDKNEMPAPPLDRLAAACYNHAIS